MVSIEEIARERGIDEDLALECLQEFYDYTSNHDLPDLLRALDENNLGGVSERAHSIKGAAFNLALNEIGNCSQRIVIKSRAGETDGLRQLASSLEKQVAEIATFLERLP
jgi:HPt (histidine-containing phosphotransfer) domain-containing protein